MGEPLDELGRQYSDYGTRKNQTEPTPMSSEQDYRDFKEDVAADVSVGCVRSEFDTERLAGVVCYCDTLEQRAADAELLLRDLSTMVCRLSLALRKQKPDHSLIPKAMDLLQRKGLHGSPLREGELSNDQ